MLNISLVQALGYLNNYIPPLLGRNKLCVYLKYLEPKIPAKLRPVRARFELQDILLFPKIKNLFSYFKNCVSYVTKQLCLCYNVSYHLECKKIIQNVTILLYIYFVKFIKTRINLL